MELTGIDGTVALVTGAGQGIGEAIARGLARAGARVAAVDRNAATLEEVVADLEREGRRARPYIADVADSAAVDALVERVEGDLGSIDTLVNVAGVLRTGRVVDMSDEDWDVTFAVNARAVFLCSRAVARRLVPRRKGNIVTIASNSAGVPRMDLAVYGASKAAAMLFTKSLGLELAEYGIRCNAISPGSCETPMQRELWDRTGSRDAILAGDPSQHRVGIPLGKFAQPADIANAVLFLVSDQAGHITMHDLYVDGGATLRV
jgi:2,3-dihydro-2,3-dihydroxybenzoate dehydrogenase